MCCTLQPGRSLVSAKRCLAYTSISDTVVPLHRVSTMVLAHSKPKHRARAYEKFMQVAHHLRKMRDYCSLYAVVSGLNSSTITRLSQTKVLLRSGIEAEREAYLGLMSSLRAWQAYRNAIASDVTEAVCAVPFM